MINSISMIGLLKRSRFAAHFKVSTRCQMPVYPQMYCFPWFIATVLVFSAEHVLGRDKKMSFSPIPRRELKATPSHFCIPELSSAFQWNHLPPCHIQWFRRRRRYLSKVFGAQKLKGYRAVGDACLPVMATSISSPSFFPLRDRATAAVKRYPPCSTSLAITDTGVVSPVALVSLMHDVQLPMTPPFTMRREIHGEPWSGWRWPSNSA